ncbi:fungal-specific transcription factor domain-containing protein [Cantharellus anzutake]|uniref:fungal-specific transcription factor domain-containing protein n=1 Tax=Cantharellus anzutake TaxID=1750568 RepID=UPI001908E6F8|nr:fungal-specific transcription factor domain-containing protein [Cantharellus anzutake]KAF8340385.1 fungal-specific transcription factor domain-containing protein [Cantharellus anzutake]
MANDILASVPTLSNPFLLGAYRYASLHFYNSIRFDRVIGVANEPILAIAEISALAEWKRENEDSSRLDRFTLYDMAKRIEMSLLCPDFLERFQTTSEDYGPAYPVFVNNGGSWVSLSYFVVKISELYMLAAHVYLATVVSGAPRAYSVLSKVYTLVDKLCRHLNTHWEVIGEHEQKLLKFPIFVAACMATPELMPQVEQCLLFLRINSCSEATEVS